MKSRRYLIVVVIFILVVVAGLVSFKYHSNEHEAKQIFEKFGLKKSNISKYSLQLELTPKEKVWQALKDRNMSDCWKALTRLFEENPDVFFCIAVEGDCERRLLPSINLDARGRTVLVTFLAPSTWTQNRFVIEAWDDDSWVDDLATKVVNACTIKAGISTPAAIPVSGKGEFSFDGKDIGQVKLYCQDYVGEFEGIVANRNDEVIGKLIYKIITEDQVRYVEVGDIILRNLGPVKY